MNVCCPVQQVVLASDGWEVAMMCGRSWTVREVVVMLLIDKESGQRRRKG